MRSSHPRLTMLFLIATLWEQPKSLPAIKTARRPSAQPVVSGSFSYRSFVCAALSVFVSAVFSVFVCTVLSVFVSAVLSVFVCGVLSVFVSEVFSVLLLDKSQCRLQLFCAN